MLQLTLPCLLLLAPVLQEEVPQAASASVAAPGDSHISWPVPRTVVWEGRSSILTFEVAPAGEVAAAGGVAPPGDHSTADSFLVATSSDASVLEVLERPQVLAGMSSGTVRVRGVSEGEATLRVGSEALEVKVSGLGETARLWRGSASIVTPVQGSYSSGRVVVGAEIDHAAPGDPRLRLVLPDGQRLEPSAVHQVDGSPTLRAAFEVETGSLPAGEHELRLETEAGGKDLGEATAPLRVTHGPVVARGECEDVSRDARPDFAGGPMAPIGADASASGGRFAVLPRNNVYWTAPVQVEEHGRYQLVVRARGVLAGGAMPSLALSVDATSPLHGTTRLVAPGWQRLPVGGTVELTPGEHHLVLRLLNDLDVGDRSDRELFIDSWELVRVVEEDETLAASMMMMEDGSPATPRGPRGAGLWVGLERPLDGLEMNGRLWIRGAATWSGAAAPAPVVELVVDDEVRFVQQTARPSFALDRSHLSAGEHEVLLRASLPDGRTAKTPVQRLLVPGPVEDVEARDHHRFSVLDERWEGVAGWLDGQGEEERQRVLRPRAAMEATLELPEELEGSFRLVLEARAGGADRPARAEVVLMSEGMDALQLEGDLQGWWQLHDLGRVELREGPKTIALKLEPHGADPQLRVRSLVLRRQRAEAPHLPPTAELLYPSGGHAAFGADMAVVRAFDESGLERLDVLIDGRPQATYGHIPQGAGYLTAPILLRDVAPGEHTLAVRVEDDSGNLAETAPVVIEVLAAEPEEPGTFARASHLLNRLAYGPDPEELAELLVLGEEEWLERCLSGEGSGDRTALGYAVALNGDAIAYGAPRLVLAHALRTDNPLRTRLVLWIDDHFSTWAGKTGMPTEWGEYRGFARLGFAPFEEHLRQSATSASMLVYLDQANSYAGRINENYARELLELHTVGVDAGYTQDDVRGLAQVLAGLTVSQEAPADGSGIYQRRHVRYDPELSDGREHTLFARTLERAGPAGRFDRVEQVLELVARLPLTARFLSRKLAEHYVSVPAPEALVEELSEVFLASGGDLRELLRTIARHPDFWSAEERLADPLEYGLRVGRTCGLPQVDYTLREFLQNSGMGLFDRVTPDGYPDEDQAWADTNGLMQRWKWVQRVPWATRALAPSDLRRYSGGDPEAWQLRIVDHVALRLTGGLLGPDSQAAALEFFAADDAAVWQRVNNLCELICRLPEANLE